MAFDIVLLMDNDDELSDIVGVDVLPDNDDGPDKQWTW